MMSKLEGILPSTLLEDAVRYAGDAVVQSYPWLPLQPQHEVLQQHKYEEVWP